VTRALDDVDHGSSIDILVLLETGMDSRTVPHVFQFYISPLHEKTADFSSFIVFSMRRFRRQGMLVSRCFDNASLGRYEHQVPNLKSELKAAPLESGKAEQS
jgi:hypothetical protein